MQDKIRATLDAACSNGIFDPAKFFRVWFDEEGTALYFLFKKNLKITNIQFVELISLLRTYTSEKATGSTKHQLLFLSSRDFKNALRDLVEEDVDDRGVSLERLSLVSKLYSDLLARMVVLDTFHGSAAVFLPPNLEVDLARICYLAGYVHSCGRAVFIRAIDKITRGSMEGALDRLLRRFPSKLPIFFAPYAHEDFTRFDRDVASELRHGLDDVKFYVEKFYIEGERLPRVMTELRDKFPNLYIPPPGDYREYHIKLRDQKTIDPTRTLWLVIDSPVDENGSRVPGRYLICYDQLHFNACPFYIFDENKPAWVAHTTMPHSLVRAMLNTTLPWPDRKVRITDPFVGTGTTWFECLKFQEAEALCSDLDPIARLLVQDNLHFFAMPSESLEALADDLGRFVKELPAGPEPRLFPDGPHGLDSDALEWATTMLAQLFDKKAPADTESGALFDPQVIQELEQAEFSYRLLFYLGLRAQLRYSGAFTRQSIDRETALHREAEVLAREIEHLSRLMRRLEGGEENFGTAATFEGHYSLGSGIAPGVLRSRAEQDVPSSEVSICDCRELLENSVDILLADPPYGFNTSDPAEPLGQLYKEMLTVFVRALRDDGQLLISLPEISFTGRRLPTGARKDLVIHQVLVAAEKAGKEAVHQSLALPRHGTLLRPPYYWESEKALRRTILHFRLRSRQRNEVTSR